jgi:lysyl-tRNA synthetase class I
MTSMAKPLTPPCPKCHRIDRVEEEDHSGSSAHWYVCARCGTRYVAPPRR